MLCLRGSASHPAGGGGLQLPQTPAGNVGSHPCRGPHRIAGPRAPRPHDPPLRLDDVLLRFREGRLAVTGDIEAMYHMTYVYEQVRNMLRFLWSNGWNDSPEVYRMKVNIFGGVWSGAAAIFCLQECGKEAESESVRKSIMNSFYVDDWLQSADSEEEVQELVSGVRSCLKGGGFRLCKMTGSAEIVNCIPDKKETEPKDRSLGVVWDSVTDCFVVKCPEIGQSRLDTKRSLLRYIARFYDPLGFISPIILQGRLLFQESVKMSVGWDDLLSDDLVSRCESWAESLKSLEVNVDRCLKSKTECVEQAQLRVFSEASSKAYGACVYLRTLNKSGTVEVKFVASKAKVVPVNSTATIPRLELMAVVCGVSLEERLRGALNMTLIPSCFWMDSMIVLCWIKNKEKKLETFVANRVIHIRESVNPDQCQYVSGVNNPADVVSRGGKVNDIQAWHEGPAFLNETMGDVTPEDGVLCANAVVVGGVLCNLIERVACYHKLCTIVSIVLSWRYSNLSARDLRAKAELALIRESQCDADLERCFKKVCPVKSDDGVWITCGRVSSGQLIVTGLLAERLVMHIHESFGHMSVDYVLSVIREKYWVVRKTVRKIVRRCIPCQKERKKPAKQRMSEVPEERLRQHEPAFSVTGTDCFGPLDVKYRRGTVKRYGVIFTCLTSRCIHIEKLDSLSTESLLMAMDRFMSRRGRPQKIVSDNGGNLVRANMVIAEEINAWNQRQVEEFLLQKGVAWKFNPPYASHFGGIWERHIRTIRKLLFHLLSSQSITDEVLCTVFCQVEWIINYRPITRVNDDAEVLRPIDLLIPLRPNSGPISIVGDQKSTEVVWRQAKNLVEQFWRKWIKLYVQYLQERSKWLKKETNVRVGDIVLVCDLNVRRREWPLGKVSRVIFGRDNLVRSVEILVCGKQIMRPISKIVHLEM